MFLEVVLQNSVSGYPVQEELIQDIRSGCLRALKIIHL